MIAMTLITTPQADPCADVRHKTLEEIELWAAEVSLSTDPASGEDFNRGWEDALTETARHCRALIAEQPSGIFRTLTQEQRAAALSYDGLVASGEADGPVPAAVVMPEEPSERVLAVIRDDVDAIMDGRGGSCQDIYYGIRDIVAQESASRAKDSFR